MAHIFDFSSNAFWAIPQLQLLYFNLLIKFFRLSR